MKQHHHQEYNGILSRGISQTSSRFFSLFFPLLIALLARAECSSIVQATITLEGEKIGSRFTWEHHFLLRLLLLLLLSCSSLSQLHSPWNTKTTRKCLLEVCWELNYHASEEYQSMLTRTAAFALHREREILYSTTTTRNLKSAN